jgi:hypothetical protein
MLALALTLIVCLSNVLALIRVTLVGGFSPYRLYGALADESLLLDGRLIVFIV